MPFDNRDIRNCLLPTIDQVKKYVKLVNDPDNRDPRWLMSFLQRLDEVDGYFMGLLHKRKAGPKSLKWDIRLPLEFKITPTEKQQLAETKTRFRKSHIFDIFEDVVDGVTYGMGAIKPTWENTSYGSMITKMKTYDVSDLDYDDDDNNGLMELSESKSGNLIKKKLDPETHFLIRHNPKKNRSNYIGSYMRSAMLLSYLKYHTRWDWRDLNKRYGVPSTYATYPEHVGDNKPKIQELIEMVEKLKNDAVAVFPEYVKLLHDEALKTSSTDSFEKFVAAANTELAVLVQGQNLTTEVNGGSYAASTTHKEESNLIVVGEDVEKIIKVTNNQYLKTDYQLNYGEPRNDHFEIYLVVDEQEDYESNSRIITNLFSDPEFRTNFPLKKSEVYQKLGFTVPQEGDETI